MNLVTCRVIWLVSFVGILGVLFFSGGVASSKLPATKFATFTDPNGRYSVQYPEKWTVVDRFADTLGQVSFSESGWLASSSFRIEAATFSTALGVSNPAEQQKPLEAINRAVLSGLAETGYKFTSTSKPALGKKDARGKPAWRGYRSEYTIKKPGGFGSQGVVIVLQLGGTKWVATAETADSEWRQYGEVFEAMFNSIGPGGPR